MIQIYKYLEYRDLILDAAESKKKEDASFTFNDLALSIGVHPPYLSKVFRKLAHLSSDQIHLVCDQFLFSKEQSSYIHLLLEYAKSGLAKRKKSLLEELIKIQEDKLDTKNFLEAKIINENNDLKYYEYYLEPLAPIIHSFLQIPRFQKNTHLIASYMGISHKKTQDIIQLLEKIELVKFNPQEKLYYSVQPLMHLDKKSPLNQAYQSLLRNLSHEHIRRLKQNEKHQYCVTITMDESANHQIYSEFNLFIKKVEAIVVQAKSEGVYQLNFDFFRWDADLSDLLKNEFHSLDESKS